MTSDEAFDQINNPPLGDYNKGTNDDGRRYWFKLGWEAAAKEMALALESPETLVSMREIAEFFTQDADHDA